jgi:hypothetical protein
MKGIRVGELSVYSTPVKIQRIHNTRKRTSPRLVNCTVTWEEEAKWTCLSFSISVASCISVYTVVGSAKLLAAIDGTKLALLLQRLPVFETGSCSLPSRESVHLWAAQCVVLHGLAQRIFQEIFVKMVKNINTLDHRSGYPVSRLVKDSPLNRLAGITCCEDNQLLFKISCYSARHVEVNK